MSNIRVRVGQQNSVKVVSNVSGSLNLVNGITILNNDTLVGFSKSTFVLNFIGGSTITASNSDPGAVNIILEPTFSPLSGVSTSVIGGIASVNTLSVSGISTLGNIQINSSTISSKTGNLILQSTNTSNVIINDNLSVSGFLTVTDGIYYESGDYYAQNGVAYFNGIGKLVSSKDTSMSINESNYILSTNNLGEPVWSNVLDGGQF